ncbi:MAG: undecaprenyl/decaprenyl-phosphate alpha-N-acetylglucosaminyl 1-phosphate transferase [Oscillospiraceae bacterium]|nr:undecaprenyl/decaprenyl-phosphate alpha-N-acetylglucosaminyl 1-phosphate transferase [Oscillospiraceae bacterium]
MQLYWRIIIAVAVALVLSFAATPAVKWFAHRVGAIDDPKDARRVHNSPIPRLGGLAIFIGFILSVLFMAEIDVQVRGVLIGAVIIVVLGVFDDIFTLRAYIKLLVQIVAALVAVYHEVVIEIFSNPFAIGDAVGSEFVFLGVLSIPITVIWIVGITNSVNLIDGLDGLAVGVSTISAIVMLIIALMVSYPNVAVIMAALAGACIGFLPHNFNPAKIFMGDTGALLLGYLLATVSIIGLFKFYAVVSIAAPLLILAVPLFDTTFAFIRRLLRGQNPMSSDRGHFHHRLIDRGFSQKQAVAVLYGVSGLLGLVAIVITTSEQLREITLFITVVLAAAAVLFFIIRGLRNKK